jgi:hypothetical protein
VDGQQTIGKKIKKKWISLNTLEILEEFDASDENDGN